MGYRSIYTYEVTYITFAGEQTSIDIKATSRDEAKRVVELAPAVKRVIGEPHCKGY